MGVVLGVDVPLGGLEDGLEAGCQGGEVGVGCDALADELVLAEPSVVLGHALVVRAGRGGAGLPVPVCFGWTSFS